MTAARCINKTQLADAIASCSINSPHTVPLLQAAYYDVISLAGVPRSATAPLKALDRARMPAVVVLGDDCADGSDTGPDGWPGVGRLTRWARRAVINGSGGTVEDYRAAVLLAVECRKLVLVECGSAHLMAWHRVFAKAGVPTVNIFPSDGGHPVMPARGSLH